MEHSASRPRYYRWRLLRQSARKLSRPAMRLLAAIDEALCEQLRPTRTRTSDTRHDGRMRLRQDHGRRSARACARVAVLRRRRFSSGGQRREDGVRATADRRRPLALARPDRGRAATRARSRRPRGARLLGTEAGLPRPPAACGRRAHRLSQGRPGDHRGAARGTATQVHAGVAASVAVRGAGGAGRCAGGRHSAAGCRAGAMHPRRASHSRRARRHDDQAPPQTRHARRASGPRAAPMAWCGEHAGLPRIDHPVPDGRRPARPQCRANIPD